MEPLAPPPGLTPPLLGPPLTPPDSPGGRSADTLRGRGGNESRAHHRVGTHVPIRCRGQLSGVVFTGGIPEPIRPLCPTQPPKGFLTFRRLEAPVTPRSSAALPAIRMRRSQIRPSPQPAVMAPNWRLDHFDRDRRRVQCFDTRTPDRLNPAVPRPVSSVSRHLLEPLHQRHPTHHRVHRRNGRRPSHRHPRSPHGRLLQPRWLLLPTRQPNR